MPNTIKQAVEFICEQAARRYAPKIWLNVPFTILPINEDDIFTYVEVSLDDVKFKVIWDPRAPSPRTTSTCILVSDGFGNIVATTFDTTFDINTIKTQE